jgi:hypothetical protein
LRAVLEAHRENTLVVELPAAEFDIDLNTEADYVKALASFTQTGWIPP